MGQGWSSKGECHHLWDMWNAIKKPQPTAGPAVQHNKAVGRGMQLQSFDTLTAANTDQCDGRAVHYEETVQAASLQPPLLSYTSRAAHHC